MISWTTVARTFALVLAGAAACALPRPGARGAAPGPAERLARALVALDSGQYAPVVQELQLLARTYPQLVVGRQALLVEAAAQLDPRNAQVQLDQGAALLTQYLGRADSSDWTRPVAQTLYLMSLELGATAERVQQAEADAARARAEAGLPRLPGPPLAARLSDLEHERDRLAARVKELEAGSAQLQKQLADTVQELRRIRRTLRP